MAVLPDVIGSTIGNAIGGRLAQAGSSHDGANKGAGGKEEQRVWPNPDWVQLAGADNITTDGGSPWRIPANSALTRGGEPAEGAGTVDEVIVTAQRKVAEARNWLERVIVDPVVRFFSHSNAEAPASSRSTGRWSPWMTWGSTSYLTGGPSQKRQSRQERAPAFYQPGVMTGAGYDRMGQLLNGRSNFNWTKQFSNIVSDARNVSPVATAERLVELAFYTAPDAAQRGAEIMDPYRGYSPEGRDLARKLDMQRGLAFSAIPTGIAINTGASPQTVDNVYAFTSAVGDGLTAAGATAGARVPGIGNQTNLDVVNGPGRAAEGTRVDRFTSTQWTAPARGTGQSYRVYQQKVDWTLEVDGLTNLQRAQNGNAPFIMKDGVPSRLNLHHSQQDARGSLFEISQVAHQARSGAGGRALHPYGQNQHPYFPVDRPAFDIDRGQYWIDRANAWSGQ